MGYTYYSVRYHVYVPNAFEFEGSESEYMTKEGAEMAVMNYKRNKPTTLMGYTFDKKYCKVYLYEFYHEEETDFSKDKFISVKKYD